jgi:hypothetical protein
MLSRFEQNQRFRALTIDPRMHVHANLDRFYSHYSPHHAHALHKIDKDDVVRLGRRPRVDDCDGVNGAVATGDNPVPFTVARARLSDPRREETAPAAAGSLQTQLTLSKGCAPLLLWTHDANLWAAK